MAGNVGIIGRARVGKDTAGAWLVDNRGYERVGFADVLKEAALYLNPIVDVSYPCDRVRLAEVVGGQFGWESAKEVGDVRRILQELGMAIRAIDEEFWLRAALAKVRAINEAGRSAVITDVRFKNEADSLRRAGFHLLYVDRPDVPLLDHASEGALTADDAAYAIHNDGELWEFEGAVELFAERVEHLESSRQYGRSFT